MYLEKIKDFFKPTIGKVFITTIFSIIAIVILSHAETYNYDTSVVPRILVPIVYFTNILFLFFHETKLSDFFIIGGYYIWSCIFIHIFEMIRNRKNKIELFYDTFNFFKEFFNPTKKNLFLTIILVLPFFINPMLFIMTPLFNPLMTILIFLSSFSLHKLSIGFLPEICFMIVLIIGNYIWSCIFIYFYKLIKNKDTLLEKGILLLIFFLFIFLVAIHCSLFASILENLALMIFRGYV